MKACGLVLAHCLCKKGAALWVPLQCCGVFRLVIDTRIHSYTSGFVRKSAVGPLLIEILIGLRG